MTRKEHLWDQFGQLNLEKALSRRSTRRCYKPGPWPFSLTAGARLDVMVAAVYAIGMAAESILMGGRVNSRWLQARDWTYFCDSRPCGIVVGIGGFEAPQPIIGTPLQQVLHKRPTW
jgi:hypothetical protein